MRQTASLIQAPVDTLPVVQTDTGIEELGQDHEASGPHACSIEANHIPHPRSERERNQPGRGKPRSQKGTTCLQSSVSALRLAAPYCTLRAELGGEWSLKDNVDR